MGSNPARSATKLLLQKIAPMFSEFRLTRVMRSKSHQIEENDKDTQNTNNSTCRGDNVNDPSPEVGRGFIHDSERRSEY